MNKKSKVKEPQLYIGSRRPNSKKFLILSRFFDKEKTTIDDLMAWFNKKPQLVEIHEKLTRSLCRDYLKEFVNAGIATHKAYSSEYIIEKRYKPQVIQKCSVAFGVGQDLPHNLEVDASLYDYLFNYTHFHNLTLYLPKIQELDHSDDWLNLKVRDDISGKGSFLHIQPLNEDGFSFSEVQALRSFLKLFCKNLNLNYSSLTVQRIELNRYEKGLFMDKKELLSFETLFNTVFVLYEREKGLNSEVRLSWKKRQVAKLETLFNSLMYHGNGHQFHELLTVISQEAHEVNKQSKRASTLNFRSANKMVQASDTISEVINTNLVRVRDSMNSQLSQMRDLLGGYEINPTFLDQIGSDLQQSFNEGLVQLTQQLESEFIQTQDRVTATENYIAEASQVKKLLAQIVTNHTDLLQQIPSEFEGFRLSQEMVRQDLQSTEENIMNTIEALNPQSYLRRILIVSNELTFPKIMTSLKEIKSDIKPTRVRYWLKKLVDENLIIKFNEEPEGSGRPHVIYKIK